MNDTNRNQEVTEFLRRFGKYYSAIGDNFRALAYRNGAITVANLRDNIAQYSFAEMSALPSIGKSIASKMVEYMLTDKCEKFEEIKKIVSKDNNLKLELLEIEGFGASSIDAILSIFKVKTVDEVEYILESGMAFVIPGFKQKKIDHLLLGIKEHKSGGVRRDIPLKDAFVSAKEIYDHFKNEIGVDNIAVAGSIRRLKPLVNDIDIIVSEDNLRLGKAFLSMFAKAKEVKRIIVNGDTKVTVILSNGIQADMRVVKSDEFFTALQYFTGSKEHNIQLRAKAKEKGYKLSEYGLFIRDTEQKIPIRSEQELYKIIGVKYPEPKSR